MLFENTQDREQQAMAVLQYEKFLYRLGVTPVRSVPTISAKAAEKAGKSPESWDYDVYIHGKACTVLEIKCINYSAGDVESGFHGKYDRPYLMFNASQLTRLRETYYRKMEVSGKWYWTKEVLIMHRCTRDDQCYIVRIEDVAKVWNECPLADPADCRTDHGTKPSSREKRLVPVSIMDAFK